MSSSCENSENIKSCVKDIRSQDYILKFSEINENFEVIDKIGEGSFAVVFKVKSKKADLKERFALKFTIPTIDPKRIENELRILKKIGGKKNVIKLHLPFRVKDHIFMLMPFVDHLKFAAEERTTKLKESEIDLEKRKEHMKVQLETQSKELDDLRAKFESEKSQWEDVHRDWETQFDLRSSSERLESKSKSKRKTLF